jgi:hypothetical protein
MVDLLSGQTRCWSMLATSGNWCRTFLISDQHLDVGSMKPSSKESMYCRIRLYVCTVHSTRRHNEVTTCLESLLIPNSQPTDMILYFAGCCSLQRSIPSPPCACQPGFPISQRLQAADAARARLCSVTWTEPGGEPNSEPPKRRHPVLHPQDPHGKDPSPRVSTGDRMGKKHH